MVHGIAARRKAFTDQEVSYQAGVDGLFAGDLQKIGVQRCRSAGCAQAQQAGEIDGRQFDVVDGVQEVQPAGLVVQATAAAWRFTFAQLRAATGTDRELGEIPGGTVRRR